MSRKDLRFAWVMAEVRGRQVLMSYKNGDKYITKNSLALRRDIILSGSEQNLFRFFATRRQIVSDSKQISIKIKPVPLIKGPTLLQKYLLTVGTLGFSNVIVTAVKNAEHFINAANALSGAVYQMRLSGSATTARARFSTIDIMIKAPGISGPAMATALKQWFEKQRNVSHIVKSAFRSSTLPYYVDEDGDLCSYGSEASSNEIIEMGEEEDEDDI